MLPVDQAPGGWGPGKESTLKEGFGGAFFGGSYSRNDEHRYETTWRHFQFDLANGEAASWGSLTGRWVSGSRGSTVANGAGLAWHQQGILGSIGDYSRGVANSIVPFGIVDQVHQSRGEPTPDSDAYRAGEGSGVVLSIIIPGPAGKLKAVKYVGDQRALIELAKNARRTVLRVS